MQEPLEQLLADLKDAIDASGEGVDNKDELARLAGEVERRLSDDEIGRASCRERVLCVV